MRHYLGLVLAGLLASLALNLAPLWPIYIVYPAAALLVFCLIGGAILADRRDVRRGIPID